MDKTWINKQENNKCILFFNGWGMDENAIKHLAVDNFDICMFNNYTTLNKFDFDFTKYSQVYLIAWSLGVWAASNTLLSFSDKIKKCFAINGSQFPKHSEYGIPPNSFELTARNWDEKNKIKFNMRMLGGRQAYSENNHFLGNRTVEDQKTELLSIDQLIESGNLSEINYNTCLIGNQDLIFPSENLINYWESKCEIDRKDIPHFPFSIFSSWSELLEL